MNNHPHPDKIRQFCQLTGTEASEAERLLEESEWDCNAAVSKYFENSLVESLSAGSSGSEECSENEASETSARFPGMITRIATISEDDSDSHYVGGSVSSGQAVIDNRGQRNGRYNAREIVSQQSSSQPSFPATGQGSEAMEIDDEEQNTSSGGTIAFWRNGFVVNDGPLRDYDDPQNKEYLQAIQRNEIPRELISSGHKSDVLKLKVKEHWNEYFEPRHEVKAFSGSGHRLGDTSLSIFSESSSAETEPLENGDHCLKLDENSPVTTLQIRLMDGSKVLLKVNHHHTMEQIRRHILAIRPEYVSRPFALMTSFPLTEIEGLDVTVKEANLSNANIVLKPIQ